MWIYRSPIGILFLSTPSARRATCPQVQRQVDAVISIHALREEGDAAACGMLPTWSHFYPRPPRGGRPARGPSRRGCRSISIHALREEGDFSLSGVTFVHFDFYPRPPRGGRPSAKREAPTSGEFLSTPSARRATAAGLHRDAVVAISIHALREEGDMPRLATER